MRKLLNKKGFTLIELMVVIVIVGILAAVAIPKFTMASHKAKASEFPTVLMGVFTAEGTYMQESTSGYSNDFATIGLDDPNSSSKWFGYVITPSASTGTYNDQFRASATVDNPFGNLTTTDSATIDQSQVKTASTNLHNYAITWRTTP